MTTVCLFVVSLVGMWCETGIQNITIGDCVELGRYEYICEAETSDMPAYLSAYDTAWCDQYPTNGYGDCSHFANGTPVDPLWYGVAMACPYDLVPSKVVVPTSGLGVMECIDTGGAIKPDYREVWIVAADGSRELRFSWVIIFDVYHQFTCDPIHPECWPTFSLQAHEEWEIVYYE